MNDGIGFIIRIVSLDTVKWIAPRQWRETAHSKMDKKEIFDEYDYRGMNIL